MDRCRQWPPTTQGSPVTANEGKADWDRGPILPVVRFVFGGRVRTAGALWSAGCWALQEWAVPFWVVAWWMVAG
jgi:hypothetical protein